MKIPHRFFRYRQPMTQSIENGDEDERSHQVIEEGDNQIVQLVLSSIGPLMQITSYDELDSKRQ